MDNYCNIFPPLRQLKMRKKVVIFVFPNLANMYNYIDTVSGTWLWLGAVVFLESKNIVPFRGLNAGLRGTVKHGSRRNLFRQIS